MKNIDAHNPQAETLCRDIENIKYKDPKCLYSIDLDYGNRRVVLEYNESILTEPYQETLDQIAEQIKWCIKKSFHISETE